MKYAKVNELIDVEFTGDNEILVIDAGGNEAQFTKEFLDTFYVPVTTIENDQEWTLESVEAGYAEMGRLVKESNENEEDYIFEVESK